MIRIRVNMSSPRNNKEWLCLFGLHVRTATIILGVWHLCMNILALGALTVIVRNPSMVHELQYGSPRSDGMGDQEMAPALPTPLSKIEPPGSYRDHDLNYQHLDMSGLIYLCLMSISGMLVYGALKGKRSYLLPFFCIQLFDFAVTTLTAANFLAYLRQVHRLLENRSLPWREEIMQLSPQTLSIVVLVAFITVVMLKAYTIGIVWRCYKFLTLQRQNLVASMLPYLIPDVNNPGGLPTGRMERDYSSLLPDYDEAIAQSLKQAPPPSYQMAMSVNGHVVLNDSSAAEQTTTRATASTSSEHRETETEDEGHASTIAILTYSPPPYEGNSTSSSTTGNQPPPLGAAAGASSAQAPSSTAAPVS